MATTVADKTLLLSFIGESDAARNRHFLYYFLNAEAEHYCPMTTEKKDDWQDKPLNLFDIQPIVLKRGRPKVEINQWIFRFGS